jgi:hypothetical protein
MRPTLMLAESDAVGNPLSPERNDVCPFGQAHQMRGALP